MTLTIKLNPAERIRRAREADPSLTDDQLREKLGVTNGQIKAAFAFKGKQKTGHRA
jgi:hypothetical protein